MPRGALLLALVAACAGRPGGGGEPARPPPPTGLAAGPSLGVEPAPPDELLGKDWLTAVHARLHERWAGSFLEQARSYLPADHPLNAAGLEATLRLVVAGDGALVSLEVARASGTPEFDRAALEVVRSSAPFPAPPDGLLSDDGVAHVDWRFARDVRQDGVAGARIERVEWELPRALPMLLAAGRTAEAARRVARAAARAPEDVASLVAAGREVAGATLERALADEQDPGARREAARAIGAAGWRPAAARLRDLAGGATDLALRKAAIEALGALGDDEAAGLLVGVVVRLDGERSAAAAAALARLGRAGEVWPRLEPKRADASARTALLATLADLGEPAAVPWLAAVLADRRAPRGERAAAARALAATATAGRLAAFSDGDAAVRAAACEGLARAGGVPPRAVVTAALGLLRDRDPLVRAAAAQAAVRADARSARPEIARRARTERSAAVLAAFATGLAGLEGPDALAQLERLAASEAAEVRRAALAALAARAEPHARAQVAAQAADPDPQVRAIAVAALDGEGLHAALRDTAPEVRAAALRALIGKVGAKEALPEAMGALAGAASTREAIQVAEAYLEAAQ